MFPKRYPLGCLNLTPDKTCDVSADKTSLVSTAKTSAVSADRTSNDNNDFMVSQDANSIPSTAVLRSSSQRWWDDLGEHRRLVFWHSRCLGVCAVPFAIGMS